MGIIYKYGDVVEAFKKGEIDVLVHGVNCQGKMNSGIAKQIRENYPRVFKEYLKYCEDNKPDYTYMNELSDMLGNVQYVRNVRSGGHIFNAFTQEKYGYDGFRFCSYDAIDQVMNIISTDGIEGKIGMPKIGAGLGGGNWKVIEAIISSHFIDRDVYVYINEEPPKCSGKNDMG